MKTRVMRAIFTIQGKDFVKCIERLILFIVYPIIAFIMTKTLPIEGMPKNFFIAAFATMHAIFSPIMVISSMVAEEKEKKTLRELMLANVTTVEYLVSVGSFVLLCTMISAIPFFVIGQYTLISALEGMAVVVMGALVSIILGMALGLLAPNSVSVNAYTMPAGMIISFAPMFAGFNAKIHSVSKFIYGQQVSDWLQDFGKVDLEGILVVIVNVVLVLGLFFYAYHHNRKDS